MVSVLASSEVDRGFDPTQRVGLVQSGPNHHLIEINLFSP